ncbi:unnamed protein product [Miscanthus lutarioriparius]|uniref:Uncharacterized protein n=1 Tax=Miscanthus lutarioriparius TaxID=422564 RepID=A0A811P4B4_9POAL|nr:unnamed protein product [Miscanthus lutarioriparius]
MMSARAGGIWCRFWGMKALCSPKPSPSPTSPSPWVIAPAPTATQPPSGSSIGKGPTSLSPNATLGLQGHEACLETGTSSQPHTCVIEEQPPKAAEAGELQRPSKRKRGKRRWRPRQPMRHNEQALEHRRALALQRLGCHAGNNERAPPREPTTDSDLDVTTTPRSYADVVRQSSPVWVVRPLPDTRAEVELPAKASGEIQGTRRAGLQRRRRRRRRKPQHAAPQDGHARATVALGLGDHSTVGRGAATRILAH